jgi:hypothetical protein
MKSTRICSTVGLALLFWSMASQAQAPAAPGPAAATDVYHVMFVKATPGQAAALAQDLQQQDPDDPLASHVLLLRHVEGDDWDYCVVQHLGTEATVEIGPPPAQTATPLRAWHDDTFVAGPSWAEFQRAMGLTDGPATSVYVVGAHRAVAGHRDQLREVLDRPDPDAKVSISHVTLTHLEGGQWQFLSVDRYNSWQDFAADRAANTGTGEGWLEIREHSAYHTDTLAERVR